MGVKNVNMKPLSDQEHRIVKLRIEQRSFDSIAQRLNISQSTMRTHAQNIRVKLETSSLSPAKLKWVLETHGAVLRPSPRTGRLSHGEREIMELRAGGKSFREIAQSRGRSESTCLVLASRACRKLGLKSTTVPARIRAVLESLSTPAPMNDPAFL